MRFLIGLLMTSFGSLHSLFLTGWHQYQLSEFSKLQQWGMYDMIRWAYQHISVNVEEEEGTITFAIHSRIRPGHYDFFVFCWDEQTQTPKVFHLDWHKLSSKPSIYIQLHMNTSI